MFTAIEDDAMLHALIDGQRTSPSPGLKGHCIFCDGAMIPKCGQFVVWHWAHKSRDCDPWSEGETEWHRQWKARFPAEWQEAIAHDPVTGERHIADVRCPDGRVIEFQRSTIRPEEVTAREAFYAPMAWVIDGTKNELDPDHFRLALSGRIDTDPRRVRLRWWSQGRLLARWCASAHPVYLDFGGDFLWRLEQYDPIQKEGVVRQLTKAEFVADYLGPAEQ